MIDTDKYEAYKHILNQTGDRYIKELLAEVKRLRSILGNIKGIEMDWGIDFNHASITVTHFSGLMLSGELKLEMMRFEH